MLERETAEQTAAEFFGKYPVLALKKGQTLIRPGDEPRSVYYLKKGHVRQFDLSARSGNEVTIHIYNPGSFFPLTWAMAGITPVYFFKAMTAGEYAAVPRDEFLRFIKANPDVLFWVTQRLLGGLEGLSARVQHQSFGDAHTRIAAELVYLARHFGRVEGETVLLEELFTHQGLADLTGLSRETVSRAVEALVKEGHIHYHEHTIIINDLAALRRWLQQRL